MISLISYDLYKSDILLRQITKEYNEFYINKHVNKEQEMIDNISIISSSDNILIELVGELYHSFTASTQQSYPQIIAYTVFAIIHTLISAHFFSAKVNEWTLLSMASIPQRK
ncbi:unnamed protein product [Rotaria sordida]|uniref:Uncharacterized protein n=1 Tax=Rotaria sordida TaxID=392033 RepID=A0A816EVD2_9BILA|nr:unnamed protein product [Rotaria sordida]CAF1651433.1 unnamed protein product [Rotaria sordida]